MKTSSHYLKRNGIGQAPSSMRRTPGFRASAVAIRTPAPRLAPTMLERPASILFNHLPISPSFCDGVKILEI